MIDSTTLDHIAATLQAHRDQMVCAWSRYIAQTGYTGRDKATTRKLLAQLADRFIQALTAPNPSQSEAETIGVDLADYQYLAPETVGRTVEILYTHLTQTLPPEQITIITGRLHTIISWFITGYTAQSRVAILNQQESIIQALIGQLKDRNEALDEARQTLETRVEERTQALTRANNRLYEEITRRQQAEDAYKTLSDNDQQALFIHQDGQIAFINDASSYMTGYDITELRSMSIDDFIAIVHSEDQAQVEALFLEVEALPYPSETLRLEYRYHRKNGELRWAEAFTSKVRFKGAAAFQAVVIDITDRKRAEEALRKSETRYRNLINTSPDLMVAHVDGRVTMANPAAARMLQAPSPEHLIGKEAVALSHPDYQAIHRSRLNQLLLGETIPPLEIQLPQGDEDPIALELRTVRLESQEASPTILVVGRDITQRKQYEAQLSRANDELEVRVQERTSELTQANKKLTEEIKERTRIAQELRRSNAELKVYNTITTQIGEEQEVGTLLDHLLDEIRTLIDVQCVWINLINPNTEDPTITASAQKGDDQAAEGPYAIKTTITEAVLREGIPIAAVASSSHTPPYMVDESKALDGMINALGLPLYIQQQTAGVLGLIFSEDQSDPASGEVAKGQTIRSTLTLQDMQFLKTLAAQIGITVENIHLTRLAADVELLKAAAEMRSQLISNFTHDLKSPLGLIKFSSTTLLRDDVQFDQETQQELLTDIDARTNELTSIVNQILELDGLENGAVELHRAPTDLAELVDQTLTSMQRGLNQHRLSYDFANKPLVAHADARYVKEVLNNLLDNAIKYSPQGGAITVRGRRIHEQIEISVSDHGVGIPQEELDRIFERFYRINNKVTQNTSGFGLGLSICRGIIEAHGGRIWAESQAGQGATIRFTLPVTVTM